MPILLLLLLTQEIPDLGFEPAFEARFERPVAFAHPRDGSDRLFVVEQPGRVRIIRNRSGEKESTLALDLGAKVLSRGNEEGLLGIAFHPRFAENRKVYLQYSWPKSDPKQRRNILSVFTMDEAREVILPESEEKLLELAQPFENHNGGNLQFGPDGFLYLGLGDGGAANDPHGNGQKPGTWLGKFLRIDVDRRDEGKAYAVPRDNPFADGRGGFLPEIWSLGWRNPWGFHFDRKTGELWSGDVGQDKWEEVNIVRKGGNYGWRVRESFHEFRIEPGAGPFVDPLLEHRHGEANSITGGCVYRGKKMPELDGVYLYGDFVTGNVWGYRRGADPKKLFEFRDKQIAAFGEDRDGEVYFSTFTGGRILRFVRKPR
jgi:quinoprotein glucose dehydrogenase